MNGMPAHIAYAGRLPDTILARDYGISRRSVQRFREREGIPPIPKKPSPVADSIVEAVRFLDVGEGAALHQVLDRLSPASFASDGHRRLWRVQMRANVAKLVGRRLERVREGVYRVG